MTREKITWRLWGRDFDDESQQNAPRPNGDTFLEAIHCAVGAVHPSGVGGSFEPLADYLASGTPLTSDDRQMLAELLYSIPDRKRYGARGPRKKPRSAQSEAEYRLARRVLDQQRQYREQHNVKQVPLSVTKQFIKDDIRDGTSAEHREWQADAILQEKVTTQVARLLQNPSRLTDRPRCRPR
jgi:hypothetical protein